jgi:mono/diheme cytochrome c family protein
MTMYRRAWALAASTLAAVMISAGGMAQAATANATDPVPKLLRSPDDIARGRALFAGTCGAYCHKMTPAPADAPFLFDCTWLFGGSDQEVFHTITHGVPGSRMVPFGGAIPDEDIWRIVAYLKSASQCKR